MKKGIFTLSLDCEGLWGVADVQAERHKTINQANLKEVYSYIHDVLSHYSIAATYAFTSLFTQNEDSILEYKDEIDSRVSTDDRWYRYISKILSDQNLDGWLGRDFYLQARAAGHEIGWHGFTHHPLSENTNESIIKYELEESLRIANQEGLKLDSVVFPRNDIGHLELIFQHGFKCYRKGIIEQSKLYANKYYRVLDEFNILKKSEKILKNKNQTLLALPSGCFLNWPSGSRRFVPDYVTIKRWDNLLSTAARNNSQAHMWFHPHNMITAPKMRDTFESIISKAATKIKNGELLNMTMDECERFVNE